MKSRHSVVLTISLLISVGFGCTSSNDREEAAEVDIATGGSSATGGTAAASTTAGASSMGGNSESAGSSSTGAASSTASTTTASGTSATGGASEGGFQSTGGTVATAGSATTDGTSASGGAAAGGASPGGSWTTGGAATTGGTRPTGGASSTIGKFVGNITFRNQVDVAGLNYSAYWDQITPENAGKWSSVQPNVNSDFKWSTLDSIYDYTEKSGIVFKEHNFVWGSQQPSGDIDQTKVQNWMQSFCDRYPHTKVIDVVNEPPPHTKPAYAEAIGGGTDGTWQWIANAFIWARAACPNATLLLNDYNIIEDGEANAHVISIVKAIQAAGAPIDAVGAEGHGAAKLPIEAVKSLMDDINRQTGLPLYITEYEVGNSDDGGQLQTYQAQFPTFLNTEYVHGITIWGWAYDAVWVDNYVSYLVKNGQPRPAMTWLMQELRRPPP